MNKEELLEYVKKEYNTLPEYLWKKFPTDAILRNKNNKWYGVIMSISKQKLGLQTDEQVDILNVKCIPELIGGLRKQNGILPAYHMNKEHWLTILLDGSVDSTQIKQLVGLSYDITNN